MLEEMNSRLLSILKAQNKQKEDKEGRFYKMLAAHKPDTYDGSVDPVNLKIG